MALPTPECIPGPIPDKLDVIYEALFNIEAGGGGSALPDQGGHAGEFLTTNGTDPSWVPLAGGGDVVASGALTNNSLIIGQGGTTVAATATAAGALTFLGAPSSANLRALMTDEGTTGALNGVIVFANAAARAASAPVFVGQLGYQTDIAGYFTSIGLAAGDWTGAFVIGTDGSAGQLALQEAGGIGTLLPTALTGNRTYTFPDLAGTVALSANNLSIFAATTSAELRGVISDELGTGALLFDGATPTGFVLTNATGLPLSTGVTGDLPFANFVPATAISVLVGRGSAGGAGDFQEITLGSGLTMTNQVLSSSGGAAVANPGAQLLGLTAINGVAATALRSDGAPALSQAIAPTWTAAHIFSNTVTFDTTAITFGALPSGATTAGALATMAAKTYTVTGTNTATAFQAIYHGVPTFTDASAGTVTDLFSELWAGPAAVAGSLVGTRKHTLGILDSTSAASSITGGLVVATTFGTAATSVGIGGGNINAGGTLTVAGTSTLGLIVASGSTYPPFSFERTSALTNTPLTAMRLLGTTSGDMTDGFGPAYEFAIRDSAAVTNTIGYIGFMRSGGDASGRFVVNCSTTGVGAEKMTIFPSGGMSIGNTTDAGTASLSVTGLGTFASTLAVTGASTFTGISAHNGGISGIPQALTGAGAVNVTTLTTALTTTGVAQALTLADGANGQIKFIVHDVDGGSAVLTPTTLTGWATATFTNAGDTLMLQFFTTRGWMVIASRGTIVA